MTSTKVTNPILRVRKSAKSSTNSWDIQLTTDWALVILYKTRPTQLPNKAYEVFYIILLIITTIFY